MSRKVYVKPPPTARAFFIVQIVLGVLFMAFGLVFVFVAEGEARPFVAIFSIIWVAGCVAIIVHAAKSLRLIKKGKIQVAEVHDGAVETQRGFATKLRELEALRKEGLISEEEYRKKRAEIMAEEW